MPKSKGRKYQKTHKKQLGVKKTLWKSQAKKKKTLNKRHQKKRKNRERGKPGDRKPSLSRSVHRRE